MEKRAVVVLVILLAFSAAVAGQQPAGPPQPGPEHKRLGYFVGQWKEEAEMKSSAFGPGGKMTINETCEWFAGGFSVVCHADFSGIWEGKELSILAYDREEKVYVYYAVSSLGEAESAKGTVEGDTWTWQGESKMGGKLIKGRFTYKEASPDTATMKYEVLGDDGKWNTVMEAKASRVK